MPVLIGSFNVTYDHDSDVLYVSLRREGAVRGVEDEFGTLWRYDRDGMLIGVTIGDFREVWAERGDGLADDIARGFEVPGETVKAVVAQGLKEATVELH